MVVIFLGWKQPKKNCVQSTFGHPSLSIVSTNLKSTTHSSYI